MLLGNRRPIGFLIEETTILRKCELLNFDFYFLCSWFELTQHGVKSSDTKYVTTSHLYYVLFLTAKNFDLEHHKSNA